MSGNHKRIFICALIHMWRGVYRLLRTKLSAAVFSGMSLLSADTCYVLSFAIIMLNTSLHNPNVRDKPGVDRFISMNRGINEGGDLPEDLLRV